VGCGDGRLSRLLADRRPDLTLQGIEVLLRDQPAIPVVPYDGQRIPFGDASFDVVLLVDVLHHTPDPLAVLREARRVARRALVIKDHLCDGWLAWPTLRFMDQVGNRRFGVSLPYNYLRLEQWHAAFAALGLQIDQWSTDLKLYPWPARAVFERSLHFVARLVPEEARRESPAAVGSVQRE
jgi:SAM-dependent methyltransferase